jgi:hypothetical protein
MKCDWCETEHPPEFRGQSRDEAQFLERIKEFGLVHVYISKTTGRCHCGEELGVYILPIAGPAHPRTPVVGHKGQGCIGPWTHNVGLMKGHGLEAKPLPCEDAYCNQVWS